MERYKGNVNNNINRYDGGITKLNATDQTVAQMQIDLAKL